MISNLSIVITTYNRGPVLETLLAQLEQQSDKKFEVVVAIDGSTDDTAQRLERLSTSYPLTWVDTKCPDYGLAVARNMGILAASGEAVVVLDDDSVPDTGFVAAHRSGARAGTITGGPRRPSDVASSPWLAFKMRELDKVPALSPMRIPDMRRDYPNVYLIENNICLLREDWINLGLFSERLKLYGFIGQEFFARAEFFDFQYQYNPDAGVTHRSEYEGDNGFLRSRKTRQTFMAGMIRPSLMVPRHYHAQVAWAKAQDSGHVVQDVPPFKLHAALRLPFRLARHAGTSVLRAVKRRIRKVLCK